MAKHVIFFVHGMGTHPEGWSSNVVTQFRESYDSYKTFKFDPFDELFEPVEIVYDDLFEARRKEWAENAAAVTKELVDAGFEKSGANKLAAIASATDGDDFVRTHVLDVILYRFLPTLAEQIRNRVMTRIRAKMNSFPAADAPQYSIIAHSLGTAVVGEAMHSWMTQGEFKGTEFASRFRPQNIFMIANVSRALWSLGGNFFQNAVRSFPVSAKGACAYYGNYAHPLDPFTHVKPFDPPADGWFFPGVERKNIYGCPAIAIDDIVQLNVHDLAHYLANPMVHGDIFLRLRQMSGFLIPNELDDHLKAYFKTTLVGKKLAEARKLLGDFTLSDSESWSGILDGITRFRSLILLAQGEES